MKTMILEELKIKPFPAFLAQYPVNWASANNSLQKSISSNVGYQNGCSNCWAHAAAGLYDAYRCISYNDCDKKISVSFLTACSPSHSINEDGCKSGHAFLLWDC